jgi:superfamily II DNA or RNA helicase
VQNIVAKTEGDSTQSDSIGRTTQMTSSNLSWEKFAVLVRAEAEAYITTAQLDALKSDLPRWQKVLLDLLEDTEDKLLAVQQITGSTRDQVVNDFEAELNTLAMAFQRLTGASLEDEPAVSVVGPSEPDVVTGEAEPCQLQLSWASGQIIAWAAGCNNVPESTEQVMDRLLATGAPKSAWKNNRPVAISSEIKAPALSAEVTDVLGWLVPLVKTPSEELTKRKFFIPEDLLDPEELPATDVQPQLTGDPLGMSARWLSLVAIAAVELVAQGRTVPRLQRIRKRRNKKNRGDKGDFAVQWMPGIISQEKLKSFADSLPGAVSAADPGPDARALVQSALGGMVNAIVATAAQRLDVPAAPHEPTTKDELSAAFLARLGGQQFQAAVPAGSDLARNLDQWARPVTAVAKYALAVQLDEPDDNGTWHLKVLSPGPDNHLDPVEVALVSGSSTRRTEVKGQLARMERLLPALLRPGGRRRGEVVLTQDEAWELMSVTGPALESAGFEVRVPSLSRRRPAAALRLTADDNDSLVGAQQLTAVSWTAMFGDVELTAADVQRLALQARPLVQSRGKWVALNHADLAEAAAALAERSATTSLTGAEMLRHALGLEGGDVTGGVSLAGTSWAAGLLRAASDIPTAIETRPKFFNGELRSYQAEALTWLKFLDGAGLGGCLALDMGLGKTPTILAQIGMKKTEGSALVIAPPAVVGNWASEARRFTPHLKVMVHHGANRSSGDSLDEEISRADLVITTYGTAVRDISQLSKTPWDRVILDEAQVIKNHTSETARQLRLLKSRVRIALTGTPIENGLGDLWAIMDFCNPGLVGGRPQFIAQLNQLSDTKAAAESALHALNGVLVFRRTKSEPSIAAELPDRIDELAHCTMTPEQVGLYQAVLDKLVLETADSINTKKARKGAVLAAITALKQICNHPLNYQPDGVDKSLAGRSGKLTRLDEIVDTVFAAEERVLIFTHFATWGERLSKYLAERTGTNVDCYHGGLGRTARDKIVDTFQKGKGRGALVLSLKAGGTGLNLTAASHVVLYDRWWNPAVEDQARDRVWRIGQDKTVICHRLICPGTVDERVEEVVQGKRKIADMVLPKSSSISDLDAEQLRSALGLNEVALLTDDGDTGLAVEHNLVSGGRA